MAGRWTERPPPPAHSRISGAAEVPHQLAYDRERFGVVAAQRNAEGAFAHGDEVMAAQEDYTRDS